MWLIPEAEAMSRTHMVLSFQTLPSRMLFEVVEWVTRPGTPVNLRFEKYIFKLNLNQ